jgi:NAD(P)-dependent dehydrogenase (short-subunit alcohol dehydrogenase family)
MKIIVLGASGRVGQEVVKALSPKHEVIRVGRSQGDLRADYTDKSSVLKMFEDVGDFDGLIVTVGGDSVFKHFRDLEDADFMLGFERKFLAQINLVKEGYKFIRDGGSFTLSSGFLSHYPNKNSAATGPFNAAVDAYVHGVAPHLERGVRLNVVSPAPVVEPERIGVGLISAEDSAQAYVESVTGSFTGQILKVWGGLEKNHE